MTEVCIHIGFHKTGTSWLQKVLFTEESSNCVVIPRDEINKLFVAGYPFAFDPEKCKDKIQRYTETAYRKDTNLILSCEALSGDPYSGQATVKETTKRLKMVFPDAKILLVIREQKSMILSLYGQFVRKQGSLSLNEFLDPPAKCKGTSMDLRMLEFHRYISYLQRTFGESNVLVLPMERLQADARGYICDIVEFMGLQPFCIDALISGAPWRTNLALPPVVINVKRYLNPFMMYGRMNLGSMFHFPGSSRLAKLVLSSVEQLTPGLLNEKLIQKRKTYVSNYVGDRFADSNRITSELIGVNLGDYRYDI